MQKKIRMFFKNQNKKRKGDKNIGQKNQKRIRKNIYLKQTNSIEKLPSFVAFL